jgi:hypothetical protein
MAEKIIFFILLDFNLQIVFYYVIIQLFNL